MREKLSPREFSGLGFRAWTGGSAGVGVPCSDPRKSGGGGDSICIYNAAPHRQASLGRSSRDVSLT